MAKVLTEISAVSWEHPADRAALQTLRSVPGFDEAVKKIMVFFGERGIRLIFQADAVRVGPDQFPGLHAMMTEVTQTMDWPKQPELYITQTPIVNASAVGFEDPFIVLHSSMLRLLDEDETRVIVGHELGHIMSGHALYRTITLLILIFGFQNLPFLAGLALLPIKFALLEWFRKSELSSDRAGLLASQDPKSSKSTFMRLASGSEQYAPVPLIANPDLEVYMEQAREYQDLGGLDHVYKLLNTVGMTHPHHTLRAAQLQNWIDDGAYDRIMNGEYTHRGQEEEDRPLRPDLTEAAKYYTQGAKEMGSDMVDAARKAASAFTDAIKERAKK
jgi:Zn-dependent protease with chaperone function